MQIIRTCLRHPLTLKVLLVKILCQFLERIFFAILKQLPSHIRTSKKENIKTQWSLACERQQQSHFEEGYEQPLLSAKVAGKKEAAALIPVDNSELVATVTASLEQGTRVKAVVVQLTADQTLKATGSFPVLIKKCI